MTYITFENGQGTINWEALEIEVSEHFAEMVTDFINEKDCRVEVKSNSFQVEIYVYADGVITIFEYQRTGDYKFFMLDKFQVATISEMMNR